MKRMIPELRQTRCSTLAEIKIPFQSLDQHSGEAIWVSGTLTLSMCEGNAVGCGFEKASRCLAELICKGSRACSCSSRPWLNCTAQHS